MASLITVLVVSAFMAGSAENSKQSDQAKLVRRHGEEEIGEAQVGAGGEVEKVVGMFRQHDGAQRGVAQVTAGGEVGVAFKSEGAGITRSTICSKMWTGKEVYGKDGDSQCDVVPLMPHWTWGGGTPPKMCLRPYHDFVSDVVREQKRWPDCAALAFLWKNLDDAVVEADSSTFAPCGGEGVNKLFVDVGANIGTCTMQMLSRPDVAQVVSFEPNPKNLFYLTSSALKDPSYTSRLALFPVALGESDANHTMFMTPGNAGNTVLDAAVAANPISDVQPTKVKTITLDEVFLGGRQPPYIHLMKVDAQGFEVHILKGARQLLATGAINAIHFELAPAWLIGQGTSATELFNILQASGYSLRHSIEDFTEDAKLPDTLSHDDLVQIACKENDVAPRDFIAMYDRTKAVDTTPTITCT